MRTSRSRSLSTASPGPHRVTPMRDSRGSGPSSKFSVATEDANALASALSKSLLREGGWYCDFHSDQEVVVVFHDRIFRYQSGDRAARDEAECYARSMGVPETQLDWPEPQCS
jgi:hypothetical protein